MQNVDAKGSINGDPATKIFVFVFLVVLTIATAGVIAAIAAGNVSHYRYFSPHTITNSTGSLSNVTRSQQKSVRLWLSREELPSILKSEPKIFSVRTMTMNMKAQQR